MKKSPQIGDIIRVNHTQKIYLILKRVYLSDSGGYGYDGMELTNPYEIPNIPYPWTPKDYGEENVWTDWNTPDGFTILGHVDLDVRVHWRVIFPPFHQAVYHPEN